MTDPITEATTQATQHGGPGFNAGLVILGGVATAIAQALVKVFGTPKERAEAEVMEATAEATREDTQQIKAESYRIAAERDNAYSELDSCKESLRKFDARAKVLETALDEHRKCEGRIAELESELKASREDREWMQQAIDAAFEGKPKPPRKPGDTTPPPSYTGDDVLKEMERQKAKAEAERELD